jgi:hypothetical protein
MPNGQRVTLVVEVDLDAVPGAFHTPESAEEHVRQILINSIPHYWPTVHRQL